MRRTPGPTCPFRAALLIALLGAITFGGSFDCRGSVGDDDDDSQVVVTSPKHAVR